MKQTKTISNEKQDSYRTTLIINTRQRQFLKEKSKRTGMSVLSIIRQYIEQDIINEQILQERFPCKEKNITVETFGNSK